MLKSIGLIISSSYSLDNSQKGVYLVKKCVKPINSECPWHNEQVSNANEHEPINHIF